MEIDIEYKEAKDFEKSALVVSLKDFRDLEKQNKELVDWSKVLHEREQQMYNEVLMLRLALEAAYVCNQNMHCYQTKGKLHQQLNEQTKILRVVLK